MFREQAANGGELIPKRKKPRVNRVVRISFFGVP
jgi:hypothetical protein